MPSNVAQSYPYKKESEAERAAAIALTLGAREGLAEKLSAEALPYENTSDGEAGLALPQCWLPWRDAHRRLCTRPPRTRRPLRRLRHDRPALSMNHESADE